MLGLLRALVEVFLSKPRELRVPDEVLSAVQPPPVPMSPHHSANELGVVIVRSSVVDKVSRLDIVGGSRDR